MASIIHFLRRQWFLVGLVIALVLGSLFANRLAFLADNRWLRYAVVASVMFVMAVTMELAALKQVLRRPWAPLLGSAVNLVLTPLVAYPFVQIIGGELGAGLVVVAATPCTLVSATVWTRRAGGNDAVAMLVTLITNATCFIFTPLWIYLLTSSRAENFPLATTVLKLLFLVVLPIFAAQGLRASAGVRQFARRRKVGLGYYAQLGILFMVTLGAVQTGRRMLDIDLSQAALSILGCLISVVMIHLGIFYMGVWGARKVGMTQGEQIAIGFSGSQKTIMVGLSTALELGFSVIPLVAYHTVQLIVDTLIADRIRTRTEAGRAVSSGDAARIVSEEDD